VLVLPTIGLRGVAAAAPAGSATHDPKLRVLTVGTFDGKGEVFNADGTLTVWFTGPSLTCG